MEGTESNPTQQEDAQINPEISRILADTIEEFQECVKDILQEIGPDESFSKLTAKIYDKKKSYLTKHVTELSRLHEMLADQHVRLIEKVSKNCPSLIQSHPLESSDSTSPQVTQTLAPKRSTATGFNVLLQPDGGGFYLSKVKESSHSGSESSMSSVNKPPVPPVNDDALKVKETKDSGSESSKSSVNKPAVPPVNDDVLNVEETKDSGSESSMASVNMPAVPPVNDDALKAEETEVLLEKISSLEEEVTSLKQKLQSLTVENGELKQEIEENVTDIRVYMSESKLEIKALEEELKASKKFAETIDEHMCELLAEKISNKSKHDAEMIEMNKKMTQYMNEISELKSTHEKKENIWNSVTAKLKDELKEKCELVDEMSQNMEALIIDESSQKNLIHQLKTELLSIKFENAGLIPPFANIQKLTDEVKLKLVALEKEVDKQREAMINRKK